MKRLILGVDAAWTARAASGIALIEWIDGTRRLCAPPRADTNDFTQELALNPDVIAIDMPIAREPIVGRRPADNEISKHFGRYKASVHSPSHLRPGAYGGSVVQTVLERGYEIGTADGLLPERAFLEVFPLAALVRCLNIDERPKYKVLIATRYWRADAPIERRRKLRDEWQRIEAYLQSEISELPPLVPPDFLTLPASRLKPYEDAMDAVVCALVGAFYIERKIEAFGDGDSAIWVPSIGCSATSPTLRS